MAQARGFKEISRVLSRIDGRGYGAYKELLDAYEAVDGVMLRVSRVQSDPYAPPSVVEARLAVDLRSRLPLDPVPVADLFHRALYGLLGRYGIDGAGEGGGGRLSLPKPSPIIVPRSAVEARVRGSRVEFTVRVWAGLPSRRRRVLGSVCEELLLERLPAALREAAGRLGGDTLERHLRAWVEQEYIRGKLPSMGLAAFVGDGSVLPRRCGGCWEPLEDAVPFESPPSLRVEIELPTGRVVSGLGVRRGVTLIAGPAFHGKTTLAEAISHGVWNHVPGDGRELVVTVHDAFYVESENGRWVSCVDVSSLVTSLPSGDTQCFTTSDASGATSLAASIQEAVEAGSRVIIVDEDQAASNMIYRDYWAEKVTGKRTLNPLSEVAASMRDAGLSVVVVASGAIRLVAEADEIVVMDEYRARDATGFRAEARSVIQRISADPPPKYRMPRPRVIARPVSLVKPKVRGRMLEARNLRDRVDLRPLRQLPEDHQVETAVRAALRIASRKGAVIAREAERISRMLWRWDYSEIAGRPGPDIVYVRPQDIAFVVNRLPGLQTIQKA